MATSQSSTGGIEVPFEIVNHIVGYLYEKTEGSPRPKKGSKSVKEPKKSTVKEFSTKRLLTKAFQLATEPEVYYKVNLNRANEFEPKDLIGKPEERVKFEKELIPKFLENARIIELPDGSHSKEYHDLAVDIIKRCRQLGYIKFKVDEGEKVIPVLFLTAFLIGYNKYEIKVWKENKKDRKYAVSAELKERTASNNVTSSSQTDEPQPLKELRLFLSQHKLEGTQLPPAEELILRDYFGSRRNPAPAEVASQIDFSCLERLTIANQHFEKFRDDLPADKLTNLQEFKLVEYNLDQLEGSNVGNKAYFRELFAGAEKQGKMHTVHLEDGFWKDLVDLDSLSILGKQLKNLAITAAWPKVPDYDDDDDDDNHDNHPQLEIIRIEPGILLRLSLSCSNLTRLEMDLVDLDEFGKIEELKDALILFLALEIVKFQARGGFLGDKWQDTPMHLLHPELGHPGNYDDADWLIAHILMEYLHGGRYENRKAGFKEINIQLNHARIPQWIVDAKMNKYKSREFKWYERESNLRQFYSRSDKEGKSIPWGSVRAMEEYEYMWTFGKFEPREYFWRDLFIKEDENKLTLWDSSLYTEMDNVVREKYPKIVRP